MREQPQASSADAEAQRFLAFGRTDPDPMDEAFAQAEQEIAAADKEIAASKDKPAEEPAIDLTAEDPPADGKPAEEKPADAPADKPAETPAADKPAEGDKPAEEPPAEPKPDPVTTARLARIAKEQGKLDRDRKAWKDEQKATLDKAARWDALEAAKAKGRIEAMRQVFTPEEIAGELYQELTDHIYSGEGSGTQTITKADVAKIVKDAIEADRKQRTDADTAAKTQRQTEAETGYVRLVVEELDANIAKYPAIQERWGAEDMTPEEGAAARARIVAEAARYHQQHGRAPDAETLLGILEAKFKGKVAAPAPAPTQPAATTPPKPAAAPASKTVTSSWTSDSSPPPAKPPAKRLSAEEALEEALREAGAA